MFKEILKQAAGDLLDFFRSQIALLWHLALSHPRMTARGAVAVAVYLGAYFGLELSPGSQALLASILIGYLGVAGRDKDRSAL